MRKLFVQKNKIFLILLVFFVSCNKSIITKYSEESTPLQSINKNYSQKVLRGSNTIFRNWWNVLHYDIMFKPSYENKFISGTVTMEVEIDDDDHNGIMQIDLQEPMQIKEIIQIREAQVGSSGLRVEHLISTDKWYKNHDTYFIDVNELTKDARNRLYLQFNFEGKPIEAKQAPWDGGWVFTQDDLGRPWMSAAVQGLGSSAWFPSKDYWGDEADLGVKISMIVPNELVAIANGRLWKSSFMKGEEGNNIYTWEVTSPINNYNIIPYIGYYENFKDTYTNQSGKTLDLDYWVLDYNVEKAKKQFAQVKPMLEIFEDWMGPYPFYEDGYKLVEAPYLGMEHQSNIAYGNGFENGYLGEDRSESGWGKKFDFIIIHESGHEWFGNNITAEDSADMWIHEAFTTYTEVIYIEGMYGKNAANEYVQGLKNYILNDRPLIATYGIQQEGSVDMYNKGANIIHTLRQLINDDEKFKALIKALNSKFYHQTVNTNQIEKFISDYTDLSLKSFFDQYLREKDIPVLDIKEENGRIWYKWGNTSPNFSMPLRLENSNEWVNPTMEWQVYKGENQFSPDRNFLITLRYI